MQFGMNKVLVELWVWMSLWGGWVGVKRGVVAREVSQGQFIKDFWSYEETDYVWDLITLVVLCSMERKARHLGKNIR